MSIFEKKPRKPALAPHPCLSSTSHREKLMCLWQSIQKIHGRGRGRAHATGPASMMPNRPASGTLERETQDMVSSLLDEASHERKAGSENRDLSAWTASRSRSSQGCVPRYKIAERNTKTTGEMSEKNRGYDGFGKRCRCFKHLPTH